MALPHIFGSLPQGNTPASFLDDNFSAFASGLVGQGSTLVGYQSTATGSVLRTVAQKLTDIISITDYVNVDSTGVADSTVGVTAAIAALPASGGALFAPQGVYSITSVVINKQLFFFGAGGNSTGTVWKPGGASNVVFDITGSSVTMRDMAFLFGPTQTGGAYIKCDTTSSIVTLEDITMQGWWIGVWIIGISDFVMRRVRLTTGVGVNGIGIRIDSGLNILLDNVICTNPAGARPLAGISIQNCGDVTMNWCQWVQCVNGCFLTPGAGQVVTSVYAVSSFFDNCGTNGLLVQPSSATGTVQRCGFTSCWFSSAGSYGVLLDTTAHPGCTIDGLHFINPEIYLNGAHGFALSGTPTKTKINGGKIAGNSFAGILINGGVGDFDILNATIGPVAGITGNGTWGIQILAGTSNNFLIANNTLTGNTSGTISDASTGTNRKKIDNRGYNPIGTSGITVTASPFTYTAGDTPETIYINQGTVSLVTVQGVGVFQSSNVCVDLEPGAAVVVTYTVAPGMATTKH